ncbi:MAG TPA: hypothetical protein VGC07_03300 [Granulicella sp.]
MPASELKEILRSILNQIDALLVNQAVIATASKVDLSAADLLDVRSAANTKVAEELGMLRKQIAAL